MTITVSKAHQNDRGELTTHPHSHVVAVSERTGAVAAMLCAILISVASSLNADHPEPFTWSTPVNLGPVVNSLTGDFFPFISTDGRTLYLTVSTCGGPEGQAVCLPGGKGGFDIYLSHRMPDGSWGPPQNMGDQINTEFVESAPSLSPDGRVLFFASNRPGGIGGNDIWASRRQNQNDDFGWEPPENVGAGVNTASNEASPSIFQEGESGLTTLYFDSNRPGGLGPFTDDVAAHNGNDIYASTLQRDRTFSPAALVPNVNTTFPDRKPSISRDGLELFLGSTRPGGFGQLDLWVSTRANKSAPWSTPVNLGPTVNSTGNDAGPAISINGKLLYFQSVRPGGFGAFDLYVTMRTAAQ